MGKKNSKLWCILFLLLLVMPTISYSLYGKRTNNVNYENRLEGELPELRLENYEQCADEINDYYEDHIPFRNQLISMNSLFVYEVFHESTSEDVIIGKEGWLFYNKSEDGNSIMGYKGLNCFSEEHLARISRKLMNTEEYLTGENCEFVLFIVPDKERIYCEYLPDYYGSPAQRYRTGELISYLNANTDIRVVYPIAELKEYKVKRSSQPIYYHYDTHWNNLGAYIGAEALLGELGVETVPVENLELTQSNFSEYDLADLMNLRNYMNDDVGYDVQGYSKNTVQLLDEGDLTSMRFSTTGADPRKLMVVRDSFSIEMAPFLASHFDETVMPQRHSDFTIENQQEMVEKEQPDILVYEISERYLEELLNFELPCETF